MTHLLDSSVLVAIVMKEHVHHAPAQSWLRSGTGPVATCPITQGAMVRTMLRTGASASDIGGVLAAVLDSPRHEFWADDLSYADVPLTGVIGHRQVTDAYLAQLVRSRRGRLATFDRGLASLHDDITDLLATS